MFGWLKSIFGSEPEQEHIVPPPLPSKVKKAKKLVEKKASKRAETKKEVTKKEAPKVGAPKEKTAKPKAPAKKKEAVKTEVNPAPAVSKKKGGRPKKTAAVEPAQTEQNSPNS